MAKEIFMPKLSSTMETGTLLQWFKEEGDSVEIGEPLFEIMTDKINIEVESYDEGVLLKKYFGEDDQVPVNHVIGYIGTEGEDVPQEAPGVSGAEAEKAAPTENPEPQLVAAGSAEAVITDEKPRATPAARHLARTEGIELRDVQGSGPNGRVHKKDVTAHAEGSPVEAKATPLARKVAAGEGVDLSTVQGSGANGKVVKQDVISAKRTTAPAADTSTRKKMSGMRKVIAERMVQSKQTAPHVTMTSEIDMTKVKELRASLLPVVEKQTGFRLSYTEILIKATAAALARHPEINVSLEGDEIVQHGHVHLGLAVAVADGLMVPVIKDVLAKGLAELTQDAKEISQRARENKLLPDQMKGSTFTISNVGMYAVDMFTPVINQPESAILGVGRMQDKPVAVNGALEIRPMLTLSLSFDHRVIDGAPAAAFLTELKDILENPYELLV
ncbi:dihydrolipoamide acetyltransferase family protein [Domibacillus sp. DTU_2020_1001157_1_SI_ALB_TIR_016]|uniref:dihydrolipoamide acetyltransferase family protein n=1 Tax=Domibacillus sp. DTU_2020_1001157_1_SI_ALB_TIR_016 TaxID=3077789 RepID=UPI0028E8A05A|nr:dihydrolipoamide acetyltransferase family protein [Domibacillus sp. DTU_2020_1001157_1_SI_ALB_TIR_016]WNS81022.1 dihydrolipoamide acetyltransferase family protein [Domibacillus sp. DTU_2020_1001157_1_SI_ALB_TIR_016]